jgi:hypothetical protein
LFSILHTYMSAWIVVFIFFNYIEQRRRSQDACTLTPMNTRT